MGIVSSMEAFLSFLFFSFLCCNNDLRECCTIYNLGEKFEHLKELPENCRTMCEVSDEEFMVSNLLHATNASLF
jgi:hypothetical protein